MGDVNTNMSRFLSVAERQSAEIIKRALDPLPDDERQRILKKAFSNLEDAEATKKIIKSKLEGYQKLADWYGEVAKSERLVFEKNDCSRLHKLKEACKANRLMSGDGEMEVIDSGPLLALQHTFVVKHNWAAAFEHAEGIEDGIRLPYEYCAFEFRFSGMSFLAVCVDAPEVGIKFTLLVESGDYWFVYGASDDKGKDDALIQRTWAQIRAICIALDSEVATHEVVRAPAKLNEKRAAKGREPLADYRVIDLSRRHRIANPSGATTGTKKRLHFRRGHWRHYEAHKTWIKWQLVGNPDLGFIQKRYTL